MRAPVELPFERDILFEIGKRLVDAGAAGPASVARGRKIRTANGRGPIPFDAARHATGIARGLHGGPADGAG